jgi:hypothetical protein
MGAREPGVDAFVAKSADFAKPILKQLRDTVHQACAEVEGTRQRRLETAIEWMGEGKSRNWKYQKM